MKLNIEYKNVILLIVQNNLTHIKNINISVDEVNVNVLLDILE